MLFTLLTRIFVIPSSIGISDASSWIGYFGNFFGGVVSGSIALFVMSKQFSVQKSQIYEQHEMLINHTINTERTKLRTELEVRSAEIVINEAQQVIDDIKETVKCFKIYMISIKLYIELFKISKLDDNLSKVILDTFEYYKEYNKAYITFRITVDRLKSLGISRYRILSELNDEILNIALMYNELKAISSKEIQELTKLNAYVKSVDSIPIEEYEQVITRYNLDVISKFNKICETSVLVITKAQNIYFSDLFEVYAPPPVEKQVYINDIKL
jgi:type III secretory pathway component EscV